MPCFDREKVKITITVTADVYNRLNQIYAEQSSEPFPDCSEQELDAVLACCKRQECGYFEHPETIAANIIYSIIKGHFLGNGNKRLSVTLFITYSIYILDLNSKDALNRFVDALRNLDIINLTLTVAQSGREQRDEILAFLEAKISDTWRGFPRRTTMR